VIAYIVSRELGISLIDASNSFASINFAVTAAAGPRNTKSERVCASAASGKRPEARRQTPGD